MFTQDVRSFIGMPAVIHSEVMRQLLVNVQAMAQSTAAVLITGESGSGKEVIARAIHEYSPRSKQAWVDINCAALPDHLLESELFGYERGAFSGADSSKPGMFELASGGTLFLDEIGELDLKSQVKLLRVLDRYPHYRLGGTRKIEVDVRIVAATNTDLEKAVRAGNFRADLYHRLNQFRIAVPPLRERQDDIAALAEFFLAQERPEFRLAADAIARLQTHSWPGNVRELRNVMMRMGVMCAGPEIRVNDLPAEFQSVTRHVVDGSSYSLDKLEQEVIFHALAQASGRKDRAAQLLGISSRTLARRLKLYGVKCKRPAGHAEPHYNWQESERVTNVR